MFSIKFVPSFKWLPKIPISTACCIERYWKIAFCIALRLPMWLSGSNLGNKALAQTGHISHFPSSNSFFVLSILLFLLIHQVHNRKEPFLLTHVNLIRRFLLSFHLRDYPAPSWDSAFDRYAITNKEVTSFFIARKKRDNVKVEVLRFSSRRTSCIFL